MFCTRRAPKLGTRRWRIMFTLRFPFCGGGFAIKMLRIFPSLVLTHPHAHGDVVQRLGENQNHAPVYKYDAFGNERKPCDTDPNPFRYCGEYWDKETQEIYLRARQYQPGNGRFTSEDPARSGSNWYAYCDGNPVNRPKRVKSSGYLFGCRRAGD